MISVARTLVLVWAFVIGLAGCSELSSPGIHKPDVIRVAVVPAQGAKTQQEQYGPLVAYLQWEAGFEAELVATSDYEQLVQLFGDKNVDLAYFGGVTFISAEQLHGAEALVMRNIDTRFTSVFLVAQDAPYAEVKDLQHVHFAFGNKRSSSSHLMPRHYLENLFSLVPEEDFASVTFAGAHDKAIELLIQGKVQAAVVNTQIYRSMLREGRVAANSLRVLWETPPYIGNVWAVHGELDEGIKNRLRNAFLGLDENNPGHQPILKSMDTQLFLPASNDDFDVLRRILENRGMID